MRKVLINPPEYSGFSKTKILLVGSVGVVILIIIVLYGVFTPDKEIRMVGDEKPTNQYSSTEAIQSVNQILKLVDESRAKNASTSEVSAKNIIASTGESIMVPPIVNTNITPIQLQVQQNKYEQKQIDNKYASLSSKTLMFSSVANKSNALQVKVNANAIELGNTKNIASGVMTQYSSNAITPVTNKNSIIKAKDPYELKAGSVIPATMINGINSDIPGFVVAQVRDNIYDSTLRQYLLIPQGSKLVGRYDSHIIYGQERLLVAWNRLIYPNGNSIILDAILGTDLEGYSGFYDKVNNKYWKIFGSSFIIGLITAGMQYSQNNTNSNVQTGGYGFGGNNNPSMAQTLSGSLGQQLGQTGLSITQKNLNVSPTIIIRPNYPFNIILTADLNLTPYTKDS